MARRRAQLETPDAVFGIFETAPGQAGPPPIPRMKKGFDAIVVDLFDTGYDVEAEFKEIQEALTITDALTPGALQAAANRAEDIARRAFKLYIVGKVEYAKYTRATDGIVGAMRESATAILEKEKAGGIRTKAITIDDVSAMAAQRYTDQWEEVHDRKVRAKQMLGYLEKLGELAKSRAYTVSRMLNDDRRL